MLFRKEREHNCCHLWGIYGTLGGRPSALGFPFVSAALLHMLNVHNASGGLCLFHWIYTSPRETEAGICAKNDVHLSWYLHASPCYCV